MIRDIRCELDFWYEYWNKENSNLSVLCRGVASRWWDLNGWMDMTLRLSDKPFDGAYKCEYDELRMWRSRFKIQSESNDRWYYYELFSCLDGAIYEFISRGYKRRAKGYFYMGIFDEN